MRKIWSNIYFRISLVVVAILMIGIFALVQIGHSKTVYIGVVTSNDGPYADESTQLIAGAKIMAEELNSNCSIFTPWDTTCGIDGYSVKILPVKTEQDMQKVSAVIGDFSDETPLTSATYYENLSIPTLLTTSTWETVGDNPYSFRIVPDNIQIGTFLANYARIDIEAKTASIIFDSNDPNSVALKDGFHDPFTSLAILDPVSGLESRGKIVKEWDLSDPNLDIDTIIVNILSPGKSENPGLIFMAVRSDQAAPILVEMRRKGIKNIVVGNTDLAGEAYCQYFFNLPEEKAQPGYFTEGLYAISPIIFDGANQSAQSFRHEFIDANQAEPTWAAAVAYDAVHVIATALNPDVTTSTGQPSTSLTGNVEQDREAIQLGLASLNGIKRSDNGITGKTFFEFQDSGKPVVVGVFNQGKFISAPVQYYPVVDTRFVPDFETKVDAGHIITRGGHYFYKTEIIYSGVNFNEISNIDENESSYFVDFYVWFRYRNSDPENDPITPESLQFINALEAPEIIQVESRANTVRPGETQTLANTLAYKLFRVKGKFTSAFNFKSYPFDRQSIEIRFRHNEYQRENLIFVVDNVELADQIGIGNQVEAFNTSGDWNVGSSDFFQDSFVIRSSLGNPELFEITDPDLEYSTFNGAIPIWRNLPSFMLRNLLPVLFSIVLAYLSFYLPRNEFGTREGVLSGTILSIAFFHLSVSSFLGSIGYTTSLDNIFYMFYAIILFGLGTTLLEWMRFIDNEKLQAKLDEISADQSAPKAATDKEVESLRLKMETNDKQALALFRLGRIAYPLILLAIAVGYGAYYRDTIFHKELAIANDNVQPLHQITETDSGVVLRLGSWRADDRVSINKILAEFKAETGIEVVFEPVVNSDYEKILRLQLENGIAPDLIYLSPDGGRVLRPESLYRQGYLVELNEIVPEIYTAFNASELQTWQTADEQVYGLPIYAVSHGVYYNTKIFADLGLTPPQTWEEFLQTAQTIKDAGIIPIANGTYETTDPQRIGDYYFLSLAPTYIGGPEGRKMFQDGERCFNDPSVVEIYQAIQDLVPYMADDLETLSYTESVQRFYDGRAAMYFSGSFDIDKFEKSATEAWSVFPIPAPVGYQPYVTFHIDTAIGLNKNSEHQKEAIIFLKWLSQRRFGELIGENLPGFYPLNKELFGDTSIIKNEKSKVFLDFNNAPNTGLDVRWNLPITNVPDGRSLMQEGVFGVILHGTSPQQAADILQNGLAQWYPPAQKCVPVLTPTPTITPTPTATVEPTSTDMPVSTEEIEVTPTPTFSPTP